MSTPDSSKPAVFISYSSDDRDVAQKVCRLLEERGVPCWIAPRDVRPGGRYGEEIIRGIEESRMLLLFLSASANASNHVGTEVERAFSNRKVIVPFRIQDVKPSRALEYFIGQAQWIDAWQGRLEDNVDRVAAVLRGSSAVRAPEPGQPAPRRATRPVGLFAWAAACACVLLAAGVFVWRAKAHKTEARPADFAVVPPPATRPSAPDNALVQYHALVIGINDYADHAGAGWTHLKAARPDAEAVAETLEAKYGFKTTRLFDAQASRGGIIAALDSFVSCAANEAAVIYFAGHGFYDSALGEGYWIPSDARKTADGRAAKEDWLWNSTVAKIIGASMARHILVIADSCYSGSLLRGDEVREGAPDMNWYRRALAMPSRYLIASGDLEPVQDNAGKHSVFASQLLNYLDHTDREVFGATDLGMALRKHVSAQTGQMVQMGPLAVAGHSGGEFVFAKRSALDKLAAMTVDASVAGGLMRDAGAATAPAKPAPAAAHQLLRDALALGSAGATNAAQRLVAAAAPEGSGDRLTQAVATFLDAERRERTHRDLTQLIATFEQRKKATGTTAEKYRDAAQPRVLACIGPNAPPANAEAADQAKLYRLYLQAELQRLGRVQVVERDALDQVLQESNLRASDLADERVRSTVGQLLPAGMLLLGDLMPSKQGDALFLRLVDAGTGRILANFTAERKADESLAPVCEKLAGDIVARAVADKPLLARLRNLADRRFDAGVGRFQGADDAMRFAVVQRADPATFPVPPDRVVGKARIVQLGEDTSAFEAEWTPTPPKPGASGLWVREAAE